MFFLSWCDSAESFQLSDPLWSQLWTSEAFSAEWLSVSALAAERDDVVIGRIRAGEVTAGDVSHGSLSVDGLTRCNVRRVAWGVLIVCLFLFVSTAPRVEWCLSHWFFTRLCQCSCLNHLSSCFLFVVSASLVLSVFITPTPLFGWLNGVSVIKSSGLLCGGTSACPIPCCV